MQWAFVVLYSKFITRCKWYQQEVCGLCRVKKRQLAIWLLAILISVHQKCGPYSSDPAGASVQIGHLWGGTRARVGWSWALSDRLPGRHPLDTNMLGAGSVGCLHMFIATLQHCQERFGTADLYSNSGPSTGMRPVFVALSLHDVVRNWGFCLGSLKCVTTASCLALASCGQAKGPLVQHWHNLSVTATSRRCPGCPAGLHAFWLTKPST